jgi:hypothetical protein
MASPKDSAAATGSDADADQGESGTGTPAEEASLATLLDDVRSLWAETTAQARDIGELALLEFDLALASLLRILLAVLLLAGLCLSAWLFLIGVIAGALVASGVSLPLALLAGAIVNIVAAGVLVAFIRSLARDIRFRNLRRYISGQRRGQTAEQTQRAA